MAELPNQASPNHEHMKTASIYKTVYNITIYRVD